MKRYTFSVYGVERTVEAESLEDALKMAGIGESDPYELIEEGDFEDTCFLAAITDDILFDS